MDENNNYPDTVDSRSVDIIETIINQEEYDIPPQSRLEEVLLELKEAIEQGGGSANIYRTTTALTDGATTNPITVDDESVTVNSGDFAIYNTQEFIFDGTQWNLLGDRVGLGEMAYLDRSDMGELAFEDASDLNLGELATKDADDIHKEISDVDYAALTTEQKNDGTEYFVYETSDDNRSIVCKDANGNFKYRAFVYGVIANGSPGWNKSATDSDAPTTPPTKVNPQASGTSLIWGLTTSEKTVYFNRFSGNALNGSNASDKDASNIGLVLTGNVNAQYSITKDGTAWITANFVETLTTDIVSLGTKETGNRYIKTYDKSYGDITIDPTPTQGSSNAVSSGGVYAALQNIPKPIDYSTTEQDTGRKWIDGKPIYQKTIAIYENSQLVAGLTLTEKELSGDTIPQNIDKAISCKQLSMRSTGYIDNGNFTDKSKALVHQSAGTLYVDTDETPVYMYAILEYTKTTDTVG